MRTGPMRREGRPQMRPRLCCQTVPQRRRPTHFRPIQARLQGQPPLIGDGRFLVICPQGPHEVEIGAINGYGWYEMKRLGGHIDEEKVDAAIDELRGFIKEACARYPVDTKKMVALGFSQGGMMAYNLAMRWPANFAALIGIGTAFPEYLSERVTNHEAV